MYLKFRGVNDAFRTLVATFADTEEGIKRDDIVVRRPSRNGSVLVIDEPVCITYEKPLERVLFNSARDVNVFAVLYEALYMLAGRNDVAPLAFYSPNFRNYSDDGKTLNGSYGYRWRKARGHIPAWKDITTGTYAGRFHQVDQLDLLVAHLKADPTSRRAVLSMWNVEDDLLKIGRPCPGETHTNGSLRSCSQCGGTRKVDQSKDVCCNLSVMFSLREVPIEGERPSYVPETYRVLDMTVTNRSNDLIWGALGANFVTFSVLLEYVAARLGVGVGKYHHFSNNLHCYDDPGNPRVAPWKPAEWLQDRTVDIYTQGMNRVDVFAPNYTGSGSNVPVTVPLVSNPAVFEKELPRFVEEFDGQREIPAGKWDERFFNDVAAPLLTAFHRHKQGKTDTLRYAEKVRADDWRIAATNWLTRRINKETK